MHGLLSTDMDSLSDSDSFSYIDKTPGAEIKERVITTPEGPAPVTTVRKRFPNKNLQGIYIPEIDLTAENKELVHPWFYVHVHEDDHKRFENYYNSGIPWIDELTNRRVADSHYNNLAKKYGLPLVDTAGDYESQIREYMKRDSTADEVEQTMRKVREISDLDYYKVMSIPLDLEKEYQNDIHNRDLLTGKYISSKHSIPEFD